MSDEKAAKKEKAAQPEEARKREVEAAKQNTQAVLAERTQRFAQARERAMKNRLTPSPTNALTNAPTIIGGAQNSMHAPLFGGACILFCGACILFVCSLKHEPAAWIQAPEVERLLHRSHLAHSSWSFFGTFGHTKLCINLAVVAICFVAPFGCVYFGVPNTLRMVFLCILVPCSAFLYYAAQQDRPVHIYVDEPIESYPTLRQVDQLEARVVELQETICFAESVAGKVRLGQEIVKETMHCSDNSFAGGFDASAYLETYNKSRIRLSGDTIKSRILMRVTQSLCFLRQLYAESTPLKRLDTLYLRRKQQPSCSLNSNLVSLAQMPRTIYSRTGSHSGCYGLSVSVPVRSPKSLLDVVLCIAFCCWFFSMGIQVVLPFILHSILPIQACGNQAHPVLVFCLIPVSASALCSPICWYWLHGIASCTRRDEFHEESASLPSPHRSRASVEVGERAAWVFLRVFTIVGILLGCLHLTMSHPGGRFQSASRSLEALACLSVLAATTPPAAAFILLLVADVAHMTQHADSLIQGAREETLTRAQYVGVQGFVAARSDSWKWPLGIVAVVALTCTASLLIMTTDLSQTIECTHVGIVVLAVVALCQQTVLLFVLLFAATKVNDKADTLAGVLVNKIWNNPEKESIRLDLLSLTQTFALHPEAITSTWTYLTMPRVEPITFRITCA